MSREQVFHTEWRDQSKVCRAPGRTSAWRGSRGRRSWRPQERGCTTSVLNTMCPGPSGSRATFNSPWWFYSLRTWCVVGASRHGCAAAIVLNLDIWGPPVHLVFRVILNTSRKEERRSLFDSGTEIIWATRKRLWAADAMKNKSGINPSVWDVIDWLFSFSYSVFWSFFLYFSSFSSVFSFFLGNVAVYVSWDRKQVDGQR